MNRLDLTDKIERLPELESRAGVRFDALFACARHEGEDDVTLQVLGELHPQSGTELEDTDAGGYVNVTVVAYDAQGRVIGKQGEGFDREGFFGFEPFDIWIQNLMSAPAKIRLVVK